MRSQRPRLPSDRYCGSRSVFLTICTASRAPLFKLPELVSLARDQFLRTASIERVTIAVDCWMPDHVHMLVDCTSDAADVRRFVKLAKQRSGYQAKHRFKCNLWQPSYYDHVLREDEAAEGVVRYVLENPVRAGLAKSVTDYPFSGSGKWTMEQLLGMMEAPCWRPPRAAENQPGGTTN